MKRQGKTKKELLAELELLRAKLGDAEKAPGKRRKERSGKDLTEERKQVELSVGNVALFPEQNPFPVLRVARDGTLLYANQASSFLLKSWGCRTGQITPEHVRERAALAVDAGEFCQFESACDRFIYSFSVVPIPSTGYVNLYGLDITKFKQAEKELREINERFRVAITCSPVTIYQHDKELRFTWVYNPPAGFSGEDFLGKRIDEIYTSEDAARLAKLKREVIATGIGMRGETWLTIDGELRFIDFSAEPLRDGSGDITGLTCATIDITGRKRMEEELIKSRNELETRVQERTAELARSNKELQDFAFIASHDLREPLRKIQAFGDILAKKAGASLDAEARDYLSRMQKAATRMTDLIGSLLAYSRVASKAQPFSEIDLNEVVKEALSNLEIRISETGGRVEVGRLPLIKADKLQIVQLLQNLIGNGLKFHKEEASPHVKVSVRAMEKREPAKDGLWEITVEDNGIGFDEAYVDRIFEPFQRLHGRISPYDGIGMGLAICRKIVERHGGSITAKSTPGEGAKFIVRLPKKR